MKNQFLKNKLLQMNKRDLIILNKYFRIPVTIQGGGYYKKDEMVKHLLHKNNGKCVPFSQDDCSINTNTGYCYNVTKGKGDGNCICNDITNRCVLHNGLSGSKTQIRKLTKALKEGIKSPVAKKDNVGIKSPVAKVDPRAAMMQMLNKRQEDDPRAAMMQMLNKKQGADEKVPEVQSPDILQKWKRMFRMLGYGPVTQQITMLLNNKDQYPDDSPDRKILEDYLQSIQPNINVEQERKQSQKRLFIQNINQVAQRMVIEEGKDIDPYTGKKVKIYQNAKQLHDSILNDFNDDLSLLDESEIDKLFLEMFDNIRQSGDKDVRARGSLFSRKKLFDIRPDAKQLVKQDEIIEETNYEYPPIDENEDCSLWGSKIKKGVFAGASNKDIKRMMMRECNACGRCEDVAYTSKAECEKGGKVWDERYDPASRFCTNCCKDDADFRSW
jgi:hypothetical protein